jgi:DNA-binding MarR family transcriptional regulator
MAAHSPRIPFSRQGDIIEAKTRRSRKDESRAPQKVAPKSGMVVTRAAPRAAAKRSSRSRLASGAALAEVDDQFDPHVQGIDYGALDALVGYALRRAQLVIYVDLYRTLAPWQMSPQRYSALTLIARNEGLTQGRLAHLLGIAGSGAVILIRSLTSLGYVEPETSARDARAYALKATAAGRRALKRIDAAIFKHEERVMAVLSEKERKTLVQLLTRLRG